MDCRYCGDEFDEEELKKDVDGDAICVFCHAIALEENPEIVMKVYTDVNFDFNSIYINPNAKTERNLLCVKAL